MNPENIIGERKRDRRQMEASGKDRAVSYSKPEDDQSISRKKRSPSSRDREEVVELDSNYDGDSDYDSYRRNHGHKRSKQTGTAKATFTAAMIRGVRSPVIERPEHRERQTPPTYAKLMSKEASKQCVKSINDLLYSKPKKW